MASLGEMILTVGAKIDGFERAMGTVSSQLNAVDREAQKAVSGFAKMGSNLTTLGSAMSIAVTLPLAAAGAAVTKFAADFDLEMRKVTSLLGSATQNEFDGLSKAVLDVSKLMGVDAVGAARALYEAISAGVPKENAAEFLKIASAAAIAGVTDTKVAVDALTSAMNAYGPANLSAKTAADQMFQAVNDGKFNFEQLSAALSTALPLSAQIGVSFSDLLAAAATLSSKSFSVSEAMTSIRAAMTALISPNKQMNELLKELGFESGEALIKQRGLHGAMEALSTAANGNTQAIQEALGRVEGLGAALLLTGDNADVARKHLDNVRHASDGLGASTRATDEINKSAIRQYQILLNNLTTIAIEMGTALLPAVNSLLAGLQPLLAMLQSAVTWFTSLPAPVQGATLAIVALVAAIGPVVLIAGQIATAVTTLLPALTGLSGAFLGTSTAAGATAGVLSGPLLAALSTAAAAAGVAAAAFVAWKLGQWAYEQIPGVKALGDGIADLILKLPFAGNAIERLMGATNAQQVAARGLSFATNQLEASLRAKGITVDKTGKSTEEYSKALLAAAKQNGLMGTATDGARKKIDEIKEAIRKAESDAKLTGQAMKELGKSVSGTGTSYKTATPRIKDFNDEILLQKNRVDKLEYRRLQTELDNLQLALRQGKIGNVDIADSFEQVRVKVDNVKSRMGSLAASELPATIQAMVAVKVPVDAFAAALEKLGIKSTESYRVVAAEAAKARDAVLGSGAATDFEKKTAIYKALEAQIEYSKAAGIAITKEQLALFDRLKADTDTKVPAMGKAWKDFAGGVSTAITNAAQEMAKSLFDGDMSFGERFKTMAKSIFTAFASSFLEPITAALTKFMTTVLTDLIGGKGFGGITTAAADAYKAIKGVLDIGGAAADAVSTGASVGAAAGQVAGAGASAAGAAGSAASAAASSITSIVGAVAGVATAISSVIGNFQMAGMNKSLDLIEHETRFSQIHLKTLLEKANATWPELTNLHARAIEYLNEWRDQDQWKRTFLVDRILQLHDLIGGETNDLLREIRDAVMPGADGLSNRSVVFNVTWSASDQSGLAALRRDLAAAGIRL